MTGRGPQATAAERWQALAGREPVSCSCPGAVSAPASLDCGENTALAQASGGCPGSGGLTAARSASAHRDGVRRCHRRRCGDDGTDEGWIRTLLWSSCVSVSQQLLAWGQRDHWTALSNSPCPADVYGFSHLGGGRMTTGRPGGGGGSMAFRHQAPGLLGTECLCTEGPGPCGLLLSPGPVCLQQEPPCSVRSGSTGPGPSARTTGRVRF